MTGTNEPYQVNHNPPAEWREAIDKMQWESRAIHGRVLSYSKTGPCPRCTDPDRGIRVSLEAEAWVGLGPEEDTDVFVTCQCSGAHANRPDGVAAGCGWGGYVAGPVQ